MPWTQSGDGSGLSWLIPCALCFIRTLHRCAHRGEASWSRAGCRKPTSTAVCLSPWGWVSSRPAACLVFSLLWTRPQEGDDAGTSTFWFKCLISCSVPSNCALNNDPEWMLRRSSQQSNINNDPQKLNCTVVQYVFLCLTCRCLNGGTSTCLSSPMAPTSSTPTKTRRTSGKPKAPSTWTPA